MKIFFNDFEIITFVCEIDELNVVNFTKAVERLIEKAFWLDEEVFEGLKLEDGTVNDVFDDWYVLEFAQLNQTGCFVIAKDFVTKGRIIKEWEEVNV